VWNPGAGDAAALADMEDEEYRRFVCIEPALLGPQVLEPGGGRRELARRIPDRAGCDVLSVICGNAGNAGVF
jgi:D-hexose-6-phosphate mutarotase